KIDCPGSLGGNSLKPLDRISSSSSCLTGRKRKVVSSLTQRFYPQARENSRAAIRSQFDPELRGNPGIAAASRIPAGTAHSKSASKLSLDSPPPVLPEFWRSMPERAAERARPAAARIPPDTRPRLPADRP